MPSLLALLMLVGPAAGESKGKQATPSIDVSADAWVGVAGPQTIGPMWGRVVLLYFARERCEACTDLWQAVDKLAAHRSGAPLAVVGVWRADKEKLRGTLQHPAVVDRGLRIQRGFSVTEWPTALVIDGSGATILRVRGRVDAAALAAAVDEALGEIAAPAAVVLPERNVATGRINLHLSLPEGFEAADGTAAQVAVRTDGEGIARLNSRLHRFVRGDGFPLNVPLQVEPGADGNVRVDVWLRACRKGQRQCIPMATRYVQPLQAGSQKTEMWLLLPIDQARIPMRRDP